MINKSRRKPSDEGTKSDLVVSPSRRRPRLFDRRSVVGITAGAVGGAVGLGAGLQTATKAGAIQKRLVLEVAALGETWRLAAMPGLYGDDSGLDPADLRGSPFFLEGLIYPEGTIAGDGFIPTVEGAIGHWFCRGHALISTERPSPHVMSHQEFVLGIVSDERQFPPDMITTVGLESSNDTTQSSVRSITGGTGRYRGASGEASETELSLNSSVTFGLGENAPNLRFEFDFVTLD